jgi:hypothetical protein
MPTALPSTNGSGAPAVTSDKRQAMQPERTTEQVLVVSGVDGQLAKTGLPHRWGKKVREMRRDATLAFLRDMYKAPILAAEWTVVADGPRYEKAVDSVYMSTVPFREEVLESAVRGLMDFGWQSFEVVKAITNKGNVVVKKMKPLLQDITEILVDERGALVGVRNQPIHITAIARTELSGYDNYGPWIDLFGDEQCTLFRDVEGTNWYGEALMRRAEAAFDAANHVEEAALRFDKKVAGSHWIVYYPLGTSYFEGREQDNYEIAQAILQSLKASGMIAVPQKVAAWIEDLNSIDERNMAWRIDLKESGAQQQAFIDRLRYLDSLKARAVGLPERSVLEGQYGTKAEAEAHADFAISNLEMGHAMIVKLLNRQVVNPLLRLNFGERFINKVRVQVVPLGDSKREILRTLYADYFRTEDGTAQEVDKVDWDGIKELLGVPVVSEE